MADYLLQEDGASKFILEDASGDLLLEGSAAGISAPFIASATALYTPTVYFTDDIVLSTPGTYTWVCPPGVTRVYVYAYGGGGGGYDTDVAGANQGAPGGGGGAYAEGSVPVTPGTTYTITVGAGGPIGAPGGTGGDSSFVGDSGNQILAKGGSGGLTPGQGSGTAGIGGQASASTGTVKHSGGNSPDGISGPGQGGNGGGASGNQLADGNPGHTAAGGGGDGGAGGVGANGGGSGGKGSGYGGITPATNPTSPGGGGGGGSGGGLPHGPTAGAAGQVKLTVGFVLPFIASNTVVYTPTMPIQAPFIGSATVVYTPSVPIQVQPPFIGSTTVVYDPDVPEVRSPFISSTTRVFGVFSVFNPTKTYSGQGNGGETTLVRLAPAGGGVTAALAGGIGASAGGTLSLSGDAGMPTDRNFVVTVDSEQILLFPSPVGGGVYYIRGRALGNTTAASHADGAAAAWGDSYDMAIVAGTAIAHNFTAVIADQPSYTYPGWLICFDSSQGYNAAGDRYPMHVSQVMGVFATGAGVSGLNKCDAAQPNAVHTPTGVSDHCPSAMSNPSRISDNINVGDVAVVRYTNPESYVLDLGPRSGALQSWFGFMRVDHVNQDVTFTHTDGYIVDSLTSGTYGPGPYTGSVNGVWDDPVPLVTGIAPDASDAAGHAVPTPTPVPFTTVTLPGSDRFFTYGSPGYSRQGWPICALAVRQGNRRVPRWESWDWRDYNYVYNGFGTDDTFVQMLINRNGIVDLSVPEVELPGPQDIDGPDAVWDDGTYYFAASWYVVLFNGPYIVFGPSVGGTPSGGGSGGGGYVPGVSFGSGPAPGPPIVTVPPIEGGSGGGIDGVPSTGLHGWSIF